MASPKTESPDLAPAEESVALTNGLVRPDAAGNQLKIARQERTAEDHTVLPDSLVPLESKIVRTELTPAEWAAPMTFRVALKMRNMDELRARIYNGEIISQEEMAEKYYPTQESFQQVAAWLGGTRLKVQPADLTRLSVAAVGSVADVAQVLQTDFVRVEGIDGQEYTSASIAPSVPKIFEPLLVGVAGLQPELKARPPSRTLSSMAVSGLPALTPQSLVQYYGASGLGLDGSGQTIALIGTGNPAQSDITTFWSNFGIPQSYANVTVINPWSNTGPAVADAELAMDLEWAGAMAPGARFRLYKSIEPAQFVPAILSDLATIPSLKQVSCSIGSQEVQSDSQYYAALAAAGITVFASSGDTGQDDITQANVGPYFPASDPCVTAVGGTNLVYPTSQPTPDLPTSELGWGVSGGGASVLFARPGWQVGSGMPTGIKRLLPDVAAVAASDSRGLYCNYAGQQHAAGGTSLSSPIWAGLCALINQARANQGLAPVGLLGPRIYPLLGTNAFRDITQSDGTTVSYQGITVTPTVPGPGWDNCTGLGTPNIANLISALASTPNPQPFAPKIVAQSGDQSVNPGGTVTLSVTATTPGDSPILSYQWRATDPQFGWYPTFGDGNSDWLILKNGTGVYGTGISGSTTATLTFTNANQKDFVNTGNDLRRYDCVVQNQYGFSYSVAVTITVASVPIVATQPVSKSVVAGNNAIFNVTASGTPTPTLQWQRQASGGSTWGNVSEGGSYSGTTSGTLTVSSATTAMNNDQFRCVATNTTGTATSNVATLTVSAAPTPPPTPAPNNSSGGGGAPSLWFLGAIGLLAAARNLIHIRKGCDFGRRP